MTISDALTSRCLQTRLWLGRRRFGFLGPAIVRISKTKTVKGPCQPGELEALKFIAQHTSIPVPKVYRTYHIDGYLYIEMEYIKGDSLEAAWFNKTLSVDQKQFIFSQVTDYVNQLRALKPPQEDIVSSANLGPVFDYRVGYKPFGPFSVEEFHSSLRGRMPLEYCTDAFGQHVTQCHNRQYKTCFAHADLCPRNIIVRDGKIVAVIDWQFAGWYPEYWEYTKAHYGLLNMPDWYTGLEHGIPKYDEELAVENTLWQRLDQPASLEWP